KVNLDIYNVLGKKVCSIVEGKKLSGYTEFSWDGTAENGSMLANGCYYYSLKLNDKIYTSNKLIIAR
ncbi:MAG TPA: FlgD immunoglobulin-like domain containing protein, partial [Bacteroidia bacterium]|nr:FlgD immunoglobulin-like domain containing protein [Bacteroidia bacterium]